MAEISLWSVKLWFLLKVVTVPSHKCLLFYLDKGEFAEAGAALGVSDGDLPIVFNPPPPAEDVVHARGDFVPFIVITKAKRQNNTLMFLILVCYFSSLDRE